MRIAVDRDSEILLEKRLAESSPWVSRGLQEMSGIDGGDFAVVYTSSRVTSITRLTIGKAAEAAAK